MRWYHALLLTIVAVLVASCWGIVIGVSRPAEVVTEYRTLEKMVAVPGPTYTPYPTLTPKVVTLDGTECLPCPRCDPPQVIESISAVVGRGNYDRGVDVYATLDGYNDPVDRFGVLQEGTPVNVHRVCEGYCLITFAAPCGSTGWVSCRYLDMTD